MNRVWIRKEYDRAKRLIAVFAISIYTGLACFSLVLHNHPLGINDKILYSFVVSKQSKGNQEINNVKVISQHQSTPCFACAFENNNKAGRLQAFTQVWNNYSSSACLPFQTIFPPSFLLNSFQVRAPPIASS